MIRSSIENVDANVDANVDNEIATRVRIRVCTKSTWLWWIGFRLELILATAQAASKNTAHFKSVQKWKIIISLCFCLKPYYTL